MRVNVLRGETSVVLSKADHNALNHASAIGKTIGAHESPDLAAKGNALHAAAEAVINGLLASPEADGAVGGGCDGTCQDHGQED